MCYFSAVSKAKILFLILPPSHLVYRRVVSFRGLQHIQGQHLLILRWFLWSCDTISDLKGVSHEISWSLLGYKQQGAYF